MDEWFVVSGSLGCNIEPYVNFDVRLEPRWYYYVTWVRWNLVSKCFEIVFVSVQDRCTVCAKHIIGLEIILHALSGSPW
jgi:hypothetical protein